MKTFYFTFYIIKELSMKTFYFTFYINELFMKTFYFTFYIIDRSTCGQLRPFLK